VIQPKIHPLSNLYAEASIKSALTRDSLNGLKTNDSMKLSKRVFKLKVQGAANLQGKKTLEPKKKE
jgi:hypothetical protein